jgi:hypothetical protein
VLWIKLLLKCGTYFLVDSLWAWRYILEHTYIALVLVWHEMMRILVLDLILYWNYLIVALILNSCNWLIYICWKCSLNLWSIHSIGSFRIHKGVLDIGIHSIGWIYYISGIDSWDRLVEVASEYSSLTLWFKKTEKLCQNRFFSLICFLLLFNFLKDAVSRAWPLIVRYQAKCFVNNLLLVPPCIELFPFQFFFLQPMLLH